MPEIFLTPSLVPGSSKSAGIKPDKKPVWGWNPDGTGAPDTAANELILPSIFFTKVPAPPSPPAPPPPPPPPKEKKPAGLPDVFFTEVAKGPSKSSRPSAPPPALPPAPPPACTMVPASSELASIHISSLPLAISTSDVGWVPVYVPVYAPGGGPVLVSPCRKKRSRGCGWSDIFCLCGQKGHFIETRN